MKPIISRDTPRLRGASGRTLLRALFLGLLFLTDQAIAGYTYRLAGGECTDSNRGEVFYPNDINGGVFGPGPTLCTQQVFAEITMRDGYVPGTWFENIDQTGVQLDVESFRFTDGARPVSTTFPINNSGLGVRGVLPEGTEPSVLDVSWHEGFFFRTQSNGTWMFGEEFGARDGVCGLGSIEGPSDNGGFCAAGSIHYFSVGTYGGWQRVPEPPAIAVLALAFAVMGGLARRRRRFG